MPSVKDQTTISLANDALAALDAAESTLVPALVIAWCLDEPHRVGEVALFAERAEHALGRGDGDGEKRVRFFRQRPGRLQRTESLSGLALSRRQLTVRRANSGLDVARVGRCALLVNGAVVDKATVSAGDTIYLRGQLLLHCTQRLTSLPRTSYFEEDEFPPFGEPDHFGLLGESTAVWQLRERLAFVAAAGKHVLLHGESGAGKELAARAVHGLSPRAAKPFVARNAATLPAGLIDAELFGNAKNYPNPGMAERAGLIGEAHGGTLFLDEIAELPEEQQAHLLRVLDADGEYQRLGDSTVRRSAFTLVGATNRDLGTLKHDVLARLALRVELPNLDARREDIPLLVRHLLILAAKKSPRIAERFVVTGQDGRAGPRADPALLEHLLSRNYDTNVRELDAVLWRAIAGSSGDTVLLTDELRRESRPPPRSEPTADELRSALRTAKGSVTAAAQALGLSRFALYRLLKKHQIATEEPEGG
jgi:transcriptional regulator with PAS, ATPase and Fis domain